MLCRYLKRCGVFGLVNAIKRIAEEAIRTGDKDSSWTSLVDDLSKGRHSRSYFYLSSLPEDLLEAVILGNLPIRMQEATFASKCRDILDLQHSQGTYLIYMTRSGRDNPAERGHGFKIDEIITVIDRMRLYYDTNDPESNSFAKKIDRIHEPNAKLQWDQGERKYYDPEAFEDFIGYFEDTYNLEDIRQRGFPNSLRYKTLTRSSPYAGLSGTVMARAPEHWSQKKTESPVYGFLEAVVRHEWPSRFSTHETTYQLFRVVREDDIALNECLASVLSSAYVWEGGMSANYAGHSTGNKAERETKVYKERLRQNGKYYHELGYQSVNRRAAITRIEKLQALDNHLSARQRLTTELEENAKENASTRNQLLDNANELHNFLRSDMLHQFLNDHKSH